MGDPRHDGEAIADSLATPASFGVIFDRHFDAIHGYLQRQVGPDLADELVAQTFLVAFDKRAHYEVSRPGARPWLFGIATNLLRRHRRDVRRQLHAYGRTGVDPALDAFEGLEARVDAAGMRRALAAALARIPTEELDVLLLYAWPGPTSPTPRSPTRSRFPPAPSGRGFIALGAGCANCSRRIGQERIAQQSRKRRKSMDEIELIKELGDGLPEPRAEARDAARASLMERFELSMPKRRRPLRKRSKGEQIKTKIMVFAAAAVGAVAVLVVSAGAFDRAPVAPQLSAEEAGLKPGVVPGEVQELNLPNGQKAYGEVSPCIQSDPSGYSKAELGDPEWCFHPPGTAGAKAADTEPSEGGTYRMAHGKVYRLSNGRWVEALNSSGGG